MPNWVINSLSGYDKDLYEKYKGIDDEDGQEVPIDFNKIIPEPKEITNTVSGSLNSTAKRVVEYLDWKREGEGKLLYKYGSPLYDSLRRSADQTATDIGYKAIENPDQSLNEIVKADCNGYIANRYNDYVSLYGNKSFQNLDTDEFISSCDKYCKKQEEIFQKEKNSEIHQDAIKDYANIEEYGNHLKELKEKYGVDNWYDWRNVNWGTKWNACYPEYDGETGTIKFNTAWSIPYPVLAKIAEDNPDKHVDVYSEEETGWFDESELKDGKLFINATGEVQYNEDDDDFRVESRKEYDPPKEYTYTEMLDEFRKSNNIIVKAVEKLS